MRGEGDDRDASRRAAPLADESSGREAVHDGHAQVHEDEVEALGGIAGHGLGAVLDPDRRAPEGREISLGDRRIHRLVLDQQHVCAEGLRGRHGGGSGRGSSRARRLGEHCGEGLAQRAALDGLEHHGARLEAREIRGVELGRAGDDDQRRVEGAARAEAALEVIALTARIDEHQVFGPVGGRVGLALHGETERAHVAREGFGERGAAAENPNAAHRQGRLRGRRCRSRRELEPQMERRADLRPALDAEGAAHELRELAADGEPEPAAAEAAAGRLVGLGERLEDPADGGGIDPDAGVAHRDLDARAVGGGGGTHFRPDEHFAPRGELDGVADQIHQDLPYAQRIPAQRAVLGRRRRDDELDALRLGGAREEARAFLENLAEIEGQILERDLADVDLRQVQQVVDDLQQHARRGTDGLGEARLGRGERRAGEELRHADHAVHGRAQLVAHAIEEVALRPHGLRELAVALGELAGAQLDLGFEALAGVEDLLELEPLQPHAVGDHAEHGERVADAGPPRFPRRRVTVDGELERRAAPD